jgi:hypothetical protein
MPWLNERGMPLGVYEQLSELQAGFEQVRTSMRILRRYQQFHAGELRRLEFWIQEARAATASYLAGAIEEAETSEAGSPVSDQTWTGEEGQQGLDCS